MTTIMPESERMRRAMKYIAELEKSDISVEDLVEKAGIRFNLTPRECVMLLDFLHKNKQQGDTLPA